MDSLSLTQIDNFDRVVAKCADKQSVAGGIQRQVIEATVHTRQCDRLY
jgi:hypothetical protein